MRRLKSHIPTTTNISFGTKRKFKIKRTIRYSWHSKDVYRIPWVPQFSSLSSQTVSFGVSSGVIIPDVPSLDAVSYLIPYMCGIVSRRHSLFLHGPFQAHTRNWSCGYTVRGCVIVFWTGSVCFWEWTTLAPLCFNVQSQSRE